MAPASPGKRRLADLLGRAHRVTALLALLDHPGLGIVELQKHMGGHSGSGKETATAFQRAGLVTIASQPRRSGRPKQEISLTPLGQEIAQRLKDAADLLDGTVPPPDADLAIAEIEEAEAAALAAKEAARNARTPVRKR